MVSTVEEIVAAINVRDTDCPVHCRTKFKHPRALNSFDGHVRTSGVLNNISITSVDSLPSTERALILLQEKIDGVRGRYPPISLAPVVLPPNKLISVIAPARGSERLYQITPTNEETRKRTC